MRVTICGIIFQIHYTALINIYNSHTKKSKRKLYEISIRQYSKSNTINVILYKTIIHHTLFRFAAQAENFTLFLNTRFVLSDKLYFLVQISLKYVAIQRQKNRYFPIDFEM